MKEKYPNEIGIFMMASGLNYEAISEEEKDEKREKLQAASGYGIIKFDDEKFYRVGWLEAMDLVRARRVLVEAGLAYIPSSEVLSLVMGVFRARLSHNLVLTCRALPVLEDDARLVSMVQNLDKVELSLDHNRNLRDTSPYLRSGTRARTTPAPRLLAACCPTRWTGSARGTSPCACPLSR